MSPEDEPSPELPEDVKRKLPPALDFLRDLPKLARQEPEDLPKQVREFLTKAEQNRELMRQCGIDPGRIINHLQALLKDFEEAHSSFEAAEETLLQAVADQADALRAAVDGLEAVMQEKLNEAPFDPEVQEFREQVEQLRKLYPKLDG